MLERLAALGVSDVSLSFLRAIAPFLQSLDHKEGRTLGIPNTSELKKIIVGKFS